MKTKPYLIKKVSFFILFLMSGYIFAQAPDRMSYQAVIRNASNNLVANAVVGIKISILQTTATGTAVYQESQTPTTNANGLATLQIGGGTVISGDIAIIDWSMGLYFIKTETDPTGGTSYTITATTQLMSVPYALYAKTSGSSGGNLWTKTGTNLYPTTLTDNTGIGTTTPTAKLEINAIGNGNITGEKIVVMSDDSTTIGSYIISSGSSSVPGNQIGIKAISNSTDINTEAVDDFDMANPAGLFIGDAGSGQGVFAQTTGKGYNSLAFYSPVAEAVKGIAFSNQNAVNIGIEGQAGNGTNLNAGVLGLLDGSTYVAAPATVSAGIVGLDFYGLPNTYAGYFEGKVHIRDSTEGLGKVLTSDANGDASWQDLVTPDVHLSGANSGVISVPGDNSSTLLNDWQNLNEAYGANYNPTTGAYTIPVTGYYSILCHLTWANQVTTNADNLAVAIAINGTNSYLGYSNQTDAGKYPGDCIAQAEVRLNAGDIISFFAIANAAEATSPFSNFGIHLLHK